MTDTDTSRREALTLFDFDDAPDLADTQMMSMSTLSETAPPVETMLEWAQSKGHDVRVLYRAPGDDGMSLVWSWFGPDYALPRHSHSADCLYYVVRGEARLGNRVVGAGGGFFVPADAPYAYTAGPDGIEILEFRNATGFDMQITESPARWEKIVEGVREHAAAWEAAPDHHRV